MKTSSLLKNPIVKNSFWMLVLQGFNLILPLVTIPYVTRVLGVEGYGSFSSALNWVYYFQIIVEYGFGLWGARKVALLKDSESEKLDDLFSLILSVRIILCIISFVMMSIISIALNVSAIRYVCQVILYLMVVGSAFQMVWLYQGKENMRPITFVNVISRIVSVILIFVFVKDTNSLYIYTFLYSFTFIISSFLMLFYAKKNYRIRFKMPTFKQISSALKDAWYIFFSSALIKIFSGFAVTILTLISGDYEVGIFSALYKIPYVLVVAFSAISQAIFPNVSKKYEISKSNGDRFVNKITFPLMSLFILISIIVIIFGDSITSILFGSEYLGHSEVVALLLAQTLFAILNNFLGVQKMIAAGYQKEYSHAFVRASIIMFVVYFVCIQLFNSTNVLFGVSLGSLIAEIGITLCLLLEHNRINKICH